MIRNQFNTNIKITDDTVNADKYLYSRTEDYQNKLNDARNTYLNHYKDFYNYLDNKNGTNLWEKVSQLSEYDPHNKHVSHGTSVNDVWDKASTAFYNNGGDDNEELVPRYYNATFNSLSDGSEENYNKLWNWTNAQAPSEFTKQANDLKESVANEITDSVNYLGQLYGSNRAKRMMNRANRFAQRQGASEDMLGFKQISGIKLQSHDTGYTRSTNADTTYLNPDWSTSIEIGIAHENPSRVTAHELAHTRNLFNTRENVINKPEDSSYYGNNYDYIRNSHKKLLQANPDKNGATANDHDIELSERYSDLMATRMEMRNAGIADGINRRYRNRDIKNYLQTDVGQQDRFLQYSSNIRNVRKALNRIYNIGGILGE